jgi:predicted permease
VDRKFAWRPWRRLFRQDPAEEVTAELDRHIEERVQHFIARGMDPEDARSAAMERFGDLDRIRAECTDMLREERSNRDRRRRLNISWLDVKLGIRMLAKYPGLSIVSVIGMAVAIAIGAGYFGFIGAMLEPSLPLEDGDRVVSIRNRDVARPGREDLEHAYDYALWRDELKSVTELGAFRIDSRNLIRADGSTDQVDVAAVTASGFRLTRVPALLGRPILDEDERDGAPPVLVMAHEEWQRRFEGDPDIIGRTVRLGETFHTIVGVMPEGFRFPLTNRYWVPLLHSPSLEAGMGAAVNVFGRLADGFTLGRARAELATLGLRTAGAFPETHEYLRPQVLRYTWAFIGVDEPGIALAVRAIRIALGLLLVIVAVNVAILVYARTVTRTGEIAVRTAFGASRRRVVSQLFVEALVLSGTAAVIGLLLAGTALRITEEYWHAGSFEPPFWIDLGLSTGTIVYTALLAILAGGIVGVLPALKATSDRLQSGLQRLSARGSSMQLGRVWTALIVVQVAVAVAALPTAVNIADQSFQLGTKAPAPAADELLRATVAMPRDELSPSTDPVAIERERQGRLSDRTIELIRRLEAEPGVAAVTVASAFPGVEPGRRIEVAPAGPVTNAAVDNRPARVRWAGVNRFAPDLFDVLDVRYSQVARSSRRTPAKAPQRS